ncbi:MAG TPA: phage tail protein [Acidimicrobiales bacterium]|nr:phage tail protein [Acidimicrobiales bacterium]
MLSDTAMLGLSMRFAVVVDGVDLGGWASCQGLSVSFNLVERKEGGVNDRTVWLPGRVTYPKITLTRAMTSSDSAKVTQWLSSMVDKHGGGTAKITLFDAHNDEVASWSLQNVLPFSWKGPALSATSRDVALETLELVHEGFL